MPTPANQTRQFVERLRATMNENQAGMKLRPSDQPLGPMVRLPRQADADSVARAWALLHAQTNVTDADQVHLADEQTLAALDRYGAVIENLIGTVKVPVGVIGPLRINGLHAAGDYYIPLATSEAALIASYGRGAQVISRCGGASVALLGDSMMRAPGFAFSSVLDAGRFAIWAIEHAADLKSAAEATTRHGRLIDAAPHIEGDHVYLLCRYTTGDAAGQNMVTIATDALCRHLLDQCPVKPDYWFVEANFSGDKKASVLGFLTGRGKKVTAAVTIDRAIVRHFLHTTPDRMVDYWRMSALGGVMSGTIGVQGHYANGLAALFLATGQDVACVAESAVGVTRMEVRDGHLSVTVTLPNLTLGTVGGGTGLPSAAAGLRLLGLAGSGKAPAFAELAAGLCLAGEISIIGAMAAGHFTHAHQSLARGR